MEPPQLESGTSLELVAAITLLTFAWIIFHFVTESPSFSNYLQKRFPDKEPTLPRILLKRYSGLVVLGIIPLALMLCIFQKPVSYYGWSFANFGDSLLWIGGLGVLVFLATYSNARKPDNLAMYPQIRLKEWSSSNILHSSLSWVGYMLGYETLFRGILFFTAFHTIGLWPAIILNVSYYSLTHIPKGLKETLGAIPFGIVISYITYLTGTIWVAFVVHSFMALFNLMFSIYYHPEMRFSK